MRLVGNDGVAALFEAHAVFNRPQYKGKSLDGDDDDGLRRLQGSRQLLGLGAIAFLVVDAPYYAVGVFKLVDRVLQLRVQHGAVSHHNHRVKLLLAVKLVQRRELVRHPGNRVRLARTRAVLNQVLLPRPLAARRRQQLAHRIPLVVAREDHAFSSVLAAFPVFFVLNLQVHKAGEDVEQLVRQQHLVPQVIGGVAVDVVRHIVARAAIVRAFVKGQKVGVLPLQLGCHVHLVLAHRKVHQRTALEAQQRLCFFGHRVYRQTRGLVLFDGTVHPLFEFTLELQGGHRHAIDKQHQVNAPCFCFGARLGKVSIRRPRAVHQLRHHTQAVLGVAVQGVWVQVVLGLELAQRQTRIAVAQLVAQHTQRAKAAAVFVRGIRVGLAQLRGKQLQKLLLRILGVVGAKLLPLRVLCLLHKAQRIFGVQGQFAVVLVRRAEQPAIGLQLTNDVVLEDAFGGLVAHGLGYVNEGWSGGGLPIANVDLAGDGGGDQGGAAFLE